MSRTQVLWLHCGAFADPAVFAQALEKVPAQRRRKTEVLKSARERRLSLGAGLLLRYAFGNSADFGATAAGKPFIRGGGPFFSLSHGGDIAMLSVSDCAVGCDIEPVRPADLRIAGRFFHPAETALLDAADEADRDALFFRLWTCKESFLKAQGSGLLQPLDSFCVGFIYDVPVLLAGQPSCRFFELSVDPACCAALCLTQTTKRETPTVRQVTAEALLSS
ncbi:MAG: 4'-phosphopantetheinyl transferase superfamily protein [Clostridia bacterium]|nr:4'-phosphopantetheinyl transferase superfamily protein [Clostridia bacterium]